MHFMLHFQRSYFGENSSRSTVECAPFEAFNFKVFQGMWLRPPSKGTCNANFTHLGTVLTFWLSLCDCHSLMFHGITIFFNFWWFIYESRPRMYVLIWAMPMVRLLLSVYITCIQFPFFPLKFIWISIILAILNQELQSNYMPRYLQIALFDV